MTINDRIYKIEDREILKYSQYSWKSRDTVHVLTRGIDLAPDSRDHSWDNR